MKGGETKAPPSADLLACFPSRAHLTQLTKPICSPGRTPEPNKRHHHNRNHRLKKLITSRSGGQASPLLWGKTKSMGMGSEIAEPTSPKVTCAGQIKVIRPNKSTACRSWQSVMDEIEKTRNHNNSKKQKQHLSFKKESLMHVLSCLRGMRIDLRCVGTFPEDGCDEDEVYRENQAVKEESDNKTSRTVFSRWFRVLQENKSNSVHTEDMVAANEGSTQEAEEQTVPPPNALLLMRCRSAPVRSLFKEIEEESKAEQGKEETEHRGEGKVKEKATANKRQSLKALMEENRKKEKLLVMRYGSDFYTISSSAIANETWMVEGLRNPLSRSGSWIK